MSQYIYLIIGIFIVITFPITLYFFQKDQNKRAKVKRTWASWMLLLPIILDADRDKRHGRFLTKREWFGWAFVGLIVIYAIIFT